MGIESLLDQERVYPVRVDAVFVVRARYGPS